MRDGGLVLGVLLIGGILVVVGGTLILVGFIAACG